jgi:hypothetical protein
VVSLTDPYGSILGFLDRVWISYKYYLKTQFPHRRKYFLLYYKELLPNRA